MIHDHVPKKQNRQRPKQKKLQQKKKMKKNTNTTLLHHLHYAMRCDHVCAHRLVDSQRKRKGDGLVCGRLLIHSQEKKRRLSPPSSPHSLPKEKLHVRVNEPRFIQQHSSRHRIDGDGSNTKQKEKEGAEEELPFGHGAVREFRGLHI